MLQEFIMTRLDLFIARMVSQRACLNFAIEETAAMSGPVLELGLGNGRTYHHLRELVKGRDIFVFERKVESHPKSTPPDDSLFLGEVFDTLPQALERFGPTASIVHADLGGHNPAKNDEFARAVSPYVEPLLAPGGLMIASDRMYFENMTELELPEGAMPDRCFIYRK